MAWVAVRTENGEELASWEIVAVPGWGDQLEDIIPGFLSCLQDALDKEDLQRRRAGGRR